MISYQQAVDLLLAHAPSLPVEAVPVAAAGGRVAAAEIAAKFAVPSFDNSAMDGFALRAADAASASPATPQILPVRGFVAAGSDAPVWQPGQAVQIMTGAPVPAGADAVVPVEDVAVERAETGAARHVTLTAAPSPGANIRRHGEDWRPGDVILRVGELVTPHHVMALAALGHGVAPVRARPRLTVLTTGDELLRPGPASVGQPPGGSRIYDSNSAFLLAAARQCGAEIRDGGHVPDTAEAFATALRGIIAHAQPGDIVISTGAVSKGDLDFVPAALAMAGAEIIFHRVAIRPGKPILFAKLPGGGGFFGLPGNPVSAAVGFRFFVVPLLRAALGMAPEQPWRLPLRQDFTGKPGLRLFLKAAWGVDAAGTTAAQVLPGQESFRIQPLTRANGWIVRREEAAMLRAGELVEFYPTQALAEG